MAFDFSGMNAIQLATWGQDIEYAPAGDPVITIRAILENGEACESRFPGAHHAIWCLLADLPSPPRKDDMVSIGSDTFRVADIQPDPRDVGGVWLSLKFIRT